MSASTALDLEVRQVGARIGAEVRNLDLGGELTEELRSQLVQALDGHKALFFRDQHLDDDSHQNFVRLFGPLTRAHPTLDGAPGHPNVLVVNGPEGVRSNHWHTDVTFVLTPPKLTSLRAVTVPPFGGSTIVANQAAAYLDLPEPLRKFADSLWAVHSNDYDYASGRTQSAAAIAKGEKFTARKWRTAHPVVRVHPETGERSLFITGFAKRIVGLSQSESTEVLRLFESYVLRPENQVRWAWEPGDVIIFDNRNTTHYAPDDYGDHERELHRVTAAGDVPVGVDGARSYAVSGDDASDYSPVH